MLFEISYTSDQKASKNVFSHQVPDDPEEQKMNDELDQYISRSYKLFKNFTEIWKVVTNKYIKHEGLGSKEEPADTCEDLFKMKPTLPSGKINPS